MTLSPSINDTKSRAYCGPTVVSSITGRPVSKVREVIRNKRSMRGRETYDSLGRPLPVRGVDAHDIGAALSAFGYVMSLSDEYGDRIPTRRPTLAAWLRNRSEDEKKLTFIIAIGTNVNGDGGHWVAVHAGMFVDTFTKGKPVHVSEAPHRRARVDSIYWIRPSRG